MNKKNSIIYNSNALLNRSNINSSLTNFNLDEWIISHLPNLNGKNILDIGCGNGKQILSLLKYKCNKIYGFDYSNDSIQYLKSIIQNNDLNKNKININLKSFDMDNFSENIREKFDIILSTYAIYYSKDMINLIKSLKKYINPKSIIFLTGYGKESNFEIIDLLNKIYKNKLDPIADFINEEELKDLKKNFTNIEILRNKNEIKFKNKKDILQWWKNHKLYEKKIENELISYLDIFFSKNKYFKITKNILAIKINV